MNVTPTSTWDKKQLRSSRMQPKKKLKSNDVLDIRWGFLVIPAVLMLVIVFLAPMLGMLMNSFYLPAGPGQLSDTLTLQNYGKFLLDPFYLQILGRTFLLGFEVVVCCAVLAYPLTWVLLKYSPRVRGILTFLVISPLLISVVIRNLGWMPLLGDTGMVNSVLMGLHLIDQPLQLSSNMVAIVIGLTNAELPFMILSLSAVMRKIDPALEEAAENLGANAWTIFWRIIFPMTKTGFLAGALLVFTMTISSFTTPAMLGGHKVMVMATLVEQQISAVLNYGFGAASAVILVVVAVTFSIWSFRAERQGEKK